MVRAPHPADRREAGFTLIEMLVALAIVGLFAAGLTGMIATTARALKASAPASGSSIETTQRLLRARIEGLAPIVRTDSSDPVVDLRGDTRLFGFAAPPLDSRAPGPLQFYRLVLAPTGDLMLYVASTLDSRIDLRSPSLEGWEPVRLLGNVTRLDLAYYGPDRVAPEDRWQAFWIDRLAPPALVRIRVQFAPGDLRRWPDLVIGPRATVNAACRVVRASGRCEAV